MSKATQELKQTIKRQLASSEKFTDSQFSPEPSVVIGPNYSKYYLHRASDLRSDVQIIPTEFNPSDIQPGIFKNGYFLSAVAALCQNPTAIKRLFLTEESNKVGLYSIWLCNNGTWTPVTIDDNLPCKKRSGSYFPLFTQAANEELWISLLEKAYAKIYGSYANIEKGSCSQALRDLTGAPVEEINNHSDIEKVWKAISEGVERQYLLSCSTESVLEDSQEEYEAPDNTQAHIILDAQEVNVGESTERLVLLKNPWGQSEWKGAWSNESNLWTAELREQLDYQEQDAQDGLFWANIEEYASYFARTWVCKYSPNNKYYSVNLTQTPQVIRINVPTGQQVTVSINQKDARCFESKGQKDEYTYSYGRLLLAKIFNDQGLGYVGGAAGEKRNLEFTKTLEAGTYILTAEVEWNQTYQREFNLSFYSEGELQIEAVPDADLTTIQKSIILSSTDSEDNYNTRKGYNKYGDSAIEKFEGSIHGLLFFYYVNDSKKGSKLIERIVFSTLKNMHVSTENKSKEFEVTVVPGREVLVIYKATAADHTWNYTTTCGIRSLEADENPTDVSQEVYDYVDDFNRWEALDINEDYNTYIQERNEQNAEAEKKEDEEEEEEEEEFEVKTLSKVLDETFPEERKTADSWTRSRDPESAVSSPTKKPNSPLRKYPAVDMEIGQINLKKIPYFNYDTYDKVISIVSSDPKIVQVRTPSLKLKAGETADIKLRLYAPTEVGKYKTALEVRGKNERLEERLVIAINNHDGY